MLDFFFTLARWPMMIAAATFSLVYGFLGITLTVMNTDPTAWRLSGYWPYACSGLALGLMSGVVAVALGLLAVALYLAG